MEFRSLGDYTKKEENVFLIVLEKGRRIWFTKQSENWCSMVWKVD